MKLPHTFVINLDRSPERWTSIHANLSHWQIDHERIAAVDAKLLSPAEIATHYDPEQNREKYFAPLKNAEIACFLSHRKCWETMVNRNIDLALILEDDVLFEHSPHNVLSIVCSWMAEQTQPCMIKIFSRRKVGGKVLHEVGPCQVTLPRLPPLGTQGQLINLAAAKQLLQTTDHFFMPVDVVLQQWWSTKVNVFVLRPNLIKEISTSLGGSSISSSAKPPLFQRLKREIVRPLFRLQLIVKSLICQRF